MTVEQAKAYGKFLAERYKDEPNIIWFIGGDIRGDVKTAEWGSISNLYQGYRQKSPDDIPSTRKDNLRNLVQ